MIQETSRGVTFTHHEVDKTGLFEVSIADAPGELVLHAAAPGHPTGERVIPAGSTGGGGFRPAPGPGRAGAGGR